MTSRLRILVVDDHSDFRVEARALLENAGYDVVGEASDCASAVAAASTLRPDVVLLDIQLPDGDGFAVAAQIGSADGRARIVLISSREAGDYGSRLATADVSGFICKTDLSTATLSELVGAAD